MSFEFSKSEIERLSSVSLEEWQAERPRVVETEPFNLKARETVLREVHRILTDLKIRFWLTGGSLLGAIRDHDFIPWDDDVDLDMLEEEFSNEMFRIRERLIAENFVVRLTATRDYPKMSFFKAGQKIALGALKKDGPWRKRPRYRYSAKFFETYQSILFKGCKFQVPSPPEDFLTEVYGNWKVVVKSDVDTDYCNLAHIVPTDTGPFWRRWLSRFSRKN